MEVERLEKIKIHELAKKLGVETKKVLDAAKQANFDALLKALMANGGGA